MSKETYFRKVSVTERLPKGKVFWFHKKEPNKVMFFELDGTPDDEEYVKTYWEYWLEELPLPLESISKEEVKSAEEILKSNLVPEIYDETEYNESCDFDYYKPEVIKAMEEYSAQFRQPLLDGRKLWDEDDLYVMASIVVRAYCVYFRCHSEANIEEFFLPENKLLPIPIVSAVTLPIPQPSGERMIQFAEWINRYCENRVHADNKLGEKPCEDGKLLFRPMLKQLTFQELYNIYTEENPSLGNREKEQLTDEEIGNEAIKRFPGDDIAQIRFASGMKAYRDFNK